MPANSCAFGNPAALNVMKPNGRYRLTATADPGRLVKESSCANNSTWATVRITDTSVTGLRYGPGA